MQKILIILLFLSGTALADQSPTQLGQAGAANVALTPGQDACVQALGAAKQSGKAPIAAVVATWGVCGAEYEGSADFVTYIDDSLILGWHDKEAVIWTRDEEHVIYAYAAIWILTIGFVVAIFLRQQKLKAEIARLTADLARATSEESK
jgi:CcmD family protein